MKPDDEPRRENSSSSSKVLGAFAPQDATLWSCSTAARCRLHRPSDRSTLSSPLLIRQESRRPCKMRQRWSGARDVSELGGATRVVVFSHAPYGGAGAVFHASLSFRSSPEHPPAGLYVLPKPISHAPGRTSPADASRHSGAMPLRRHRAGRLSRRKPAGSALLGSRGNDR